ncbi:hypothetical protein NIES2100_01530 [Calothrix sp. NIES-2100]|uniref:hypothetical protein n=1 Tax=Calothrix sp. NIES-2100 TaxID=1954172 RepID=UPI000B603535|nr:hypothetical protein NIES2100_01530 [Calothrix sp. NIES-2100]
MNTQQSQKSAINYFVLGNVHCQAFDDFRDAVNIQKGTTIHDQISFDCLVIDVSYHGANSITLVNQHLDIGLPILLCNISEQHWRELGTLTGFFTLGGSQACLIIRQTDEAERLHYTFIDLPDSSNPKLRLQAAPIKSEVSESSQANVQNYHESSSDQDPDIAFFSSNFQSPERESEKNQSFQTLVETNLLRTKALPSKVSDVPPDLKFVTYTFSQSVPLHLGKPNNNNGDQVATTTHSWIWTVYYNNYGNELFQYIHLQTSATVSPGSLAVNNDEERAWSQSYFALSIKPQSDQIFWFQSSPETINNSTTVTDSTSFTINFDISESPSGGGSFTADKSTTRDITDWKIVETTAGSCGAWQYSQQNPYDATQNNLQDRFTFWGHVKELPNLSLYTLQSHTQIVWRTTLPTRGYARFDYRADWKFVDSWSTDCALGLCSTIHTVYGWHWWWDVPGYFNIDIGKVIDGNSPNVPDPDDLFTVELTEDAEGEPLAKVSPPRDAKRGAKFVIVEEDEPLKKVSPPRDAKRGAKFVIVEEDELLKKVSPPRDAKRGAKF